MRHLFVIAVAIVFALASVVLKKHREKILICGIAALCLVSGVYTYTRAESILPTRHPYNQTFYTSDYLETDEFPDAFLRLYLNGKKVYVKDDEITIDEATSIGYYWQYSYCHNKNMVHFLESVNAEVVHDSEMNDIIVEEADRADFEEVGYLNDLLRNTMMYSGIDNEVGNYLYYVWYYRDFTQAAKLYANAESLKNAEELVLIWQRQDGDVRPETEDMYLMGKDYYESHIKNKAD